MESNSVFPNPLTDDCTKEASTEVLVRQPDETPENLVSRVVDRVRRFRAAGRPLSKALICVAPRITDPANEARNRACRLKIARHLLDALERSGSTEPALFLVAPAGFDLEFQDSLLELAGRLTRERESAAPQISVRFPAHRRHPAALSDLAEGLPLLAQA